MEELKEFKQRLESHYQNLTRSEQRIASYLLTNHDEAAFLPAAELAQRIGVSSPTVVRFARSVGYDSFPELRRCLQEMFRVKVTPATRLKRKLDDLKTGQGHILHQIVDMELQYLTEAEHSIDPKDFDEAAHILATSGRVFIFGSGPSRILADLVHIRMRRFGLTTFDLTESGRDILEKLVLMQPDDCLLATGFHRVTGELVAAMDHAHRVGCRTVLVTDTLASIFRGKADVILSARRGPVSTFHSLTVPMAILNALLLSIAMSKSKETMAALDQLEELRVTYGLDVTGTADS